MKTPHQINNLSIFRYSLYSLISPSRLYFFMNNNQSNKSPKINCSELNKKFKFIYVIFYLDASR